MIPRLLIAIVLPALLIGCAGTPRRVLNPRVNKSPVVFESPRAAEAFERSVDKRYDKGEAVIKKQSATLSRNAFFNREVLEADTDLDGIISEREAYRYAEKSN
jgi:hypothetical protein